MGNVYTISYKRAIVAITDYDREKAGGISKNSFLLAAKEKSDGSFILLRVRDDALLPNAQQNDQTRQQGLDSSGGDKPWAGELDPWMRDRLSLHGIECSVVGTFLNDGDHPRFAEDIANYYAVHELMVWKPDASVLDVIVNHQHRANDIPISRNPRAIGRTRFAAAELPNALNSEFRLNPTDIMKRRTVYFGMSRSGKSNGLKVMAESVYRLRHETQDSCRVGQLIFDLNGEYAQDNPQDGKGLHRVHEAIGRDRKKEVATYGLLPVAWDKERILMKLNFFGDPIPRPWNTQKVEEVLDQLLAGREIIKGIMAHETGVRYTTAFRDADIAVPVNAEGDIGAQTRYYRVILTYQTALFAAGLTPPKWAPTLRGPTSNSLLGKNIVEAMSAQNNANSDNQTEYHQVSELLKKVNGNQYKVSWDQLVTVFTALNKFINDKKSAYDTFEQREITRSSSREAWADSRFKAVLRIFESQNGPRLFQTAQEQHGPNEPKDFAERVMDDLRQGKLVIVDQSSGDPEQNKTAAERIMWRIFRNQQELFKDRSKAGTAHEGSVDGHVLVYVEEAHNLLPNSNASDSLTTVWARSAKEGGKLNIGLVLATQAPSSIMPEILSETDNWIVSYLNSARERRVVSDYMDFEDFSEQIGKVSEPGYVRIRTLSQAYTIPVQLNRFWLGEIGSQGDSTVPSSRNGAVETENTHNYLPL